MHTLLATSHSRSKVAAIPESCSQIFLIRFGEQVAEAGRGMAPAHDGSHQSIAGLRSESAKSGGVIGDLVSRCFLPRSDLVAHIPEFLVEEMLHALVQDFYRRPHGADYSSPDDPLRQFEMMETE